MGFVLQVKNLSIDIAADKNYTAVDNINFDIKEGEIIGIVGESGCGKSLTALSIMGLLSRNVNISAGNIIFNGKDLLSLQKKERQSIFGKEISMIFQEPMTSLNPLMKIGKQVEESLSLHTNLDKNEKKEYVKNSLLKVGLSEAEKIIKKYPFELSGGMQQRVMIAMATICNPKLLIADEPTTALDVTTQTQVLQLLKKINTEYHTSILFISHDVGVIKQICDRIIVMYSGQIVEIGKTKDILENPLHEYTKGLLNSIPLRKRKGRPLECISGRVPAITEKRLACQFAPRCKKASVLCFAQVPERIETTAGHYVKCHEAQKEIMQ